MKFRSWIVAITIIALLVILGTYWWYFHNNGISDNVADWGNFGGYVSGTMGIVSVVLLLLTFIEQTRQVGKSQFESIFFELLNRQKLLFSEDNISFDNCCNEIKRHMNVSFDKNKKISKEDYMKIFSVFYEYHAKEKVFLNKFRHLYHLFKFVEKSCVGNKKYYIDIIQATMSNNELLMTMYNTIWYSYNTKDMKFLEILDKYSFFENLQSEGECFDDMKKKIFKKTSWKHDCPKDNSEKDLSKLCMRRGGSFALNIYEVMEKLNEDKN